MRVKIHPDAVPECARLSREGDNQIVKAVRRILEGRTALEDIQSVEELPGCFRWKPSWEIRRIAGEVRFVYRISGETLEIIGVAADKRDGFYKRLRSRL